MRLWELLLLAVGLSMDACAVAAANGVCCRGYTPRRILATAAVFGGFQGLMPLLGYLLGAGLSGTWRGWTISLPCCCWAIWGGG